MQVKYIYSACLEINCGGFRILTDPWFTDGIYDGSWYQYPKIDPFDYITEKPNLIYISHIHPDHYDPTFLKKLYKKFGQVKTIIPDLKYNSLRKKGALDGIDLIPIRSYSNEAVDFFIEENDTGSISDIDSALFVHEKSTGHTLLNLNDCIFNLAQNETLKEIIKSFTKKLDILTLGYTGAGPYPQTFYDHTTEIDVLKKEAKKKKLSFFNRYLEYVNYFDARHNIPFAGEYILGGKLGVLNDYRGVADAIEIKGIDSKAIIFHSGGMIDLTSNLKEGIRFEKHDKNLMEDYIQSISKNKMDYEHLDLNIHDLNLKNMLAIAAKAAAIKSEIDGNYDFIFTILDSFGEIYTRLHLRTADSTVALINQSELSSFKAFSEIRLDFRYFVGLLSGQFHWNNAIVGSQLYTNRHPKNDFRREVQSYLYYLTSRNLKK